MKRLSHDYMTDFHRENKKMKSDSLFPLFKSIFSWKTNLFIQNATLTHPLEDKKNRVDMKRVKILSSEL